MSFEELKLREYGFNDKLEYSTSILDSKFTINIKYINENFIVDVYDESGEKYLPFYILNYEGKTASEVKEFVAKLIDDIHEKYLKEHNFKEEILNYVKDKYGALLERPWAKKPHNITIKNEKGKWFGLITQVEYIKLGVDKPGSCNIINLKNDDIDRVVDNINIFPAYHMNKKHWITVDIDGIVDFEKLKELLDRSFILVSSKL